MGNLKDFLKDKGSSLVKKTNEVLDSTKDKIKDTLLKDKLKRRFQLENPHKFIISKKRIQPKLLDELTASHAKTYLEDNVFVLYGEHLDNDVKIGYFVKDLSSLTSFIVKDIADVSVPVTLNEEIYDVKATAIYCEEL